MRTCLSSQLRRMSPINRGRRVSRAQQVSGERRNCPAHNVARLGCVGAGKSDGGKGGGGKGGGGIHGDDIDTGADDGTIGGLIGFITGTLGVNCSKGVGSILPK